MNLAARHEDGQWLMVYLGAKASFSIDMSKLAKGRATTAFWVDPRNADRRPIETISNTGTQALETSAGWEDALLILESSRD